MKPIVTERFQGYLFHWSEHGITVKVSKVRLHPSDGRITGELEMQSATDSELITFYPPTQFNFSSDITRSRITKSLLAELPDLPWDEMMKQLCYGVQYRARRGEPISELWTSAENIKAPESLLEPILYKGLPTVIFGDKEACKSTLALCFYFCLMLPWQDNPLELKVPDRSIPTLILDWESDGDIVQYYAKRIQNGHHLPALPVLHRRCTMPLADDLEQIAEHIAEKKIEAVIIDSLGAACGGNLKDPEPALRFFQGLRTLKVTSLLIAQNTKDPDTRKKSIFGSTYFSYYSRSIFELCRAETTDEDDIDVALFHRNVNISKHHKPMSFRLHYNDIGLTITRESFNMAEFEDKLSATQQILQALRNGALTVDDIAEQCDLKMNTTRVALFRLKHQGKVLPTEGRKWGLKA